MSDRTSVSDERINKLKARAKKIIAQDPSVLKFMPDKAVIDEALNPELSLVEKIEVLFSRYAERPALQERAYNIEKNASTNKHYRNYQQAFAGVTFRELQQRIHNLACAWQHSKEHRVKPDDMVFIIGFASIDYQLIDIATLYAQAVTVPMQSMTSGSDLDETIANINPVTVFASVADLKVAAEHTIRHGGIKSLVVFDFEPRDDADLQIYREVETLIADSGLPISLTSLQELLELGKSKAWQPLPIHPLGEDRLAGILHSSGSTGKPKGAMLLEKSMKRMWENLLKAPAIYPQISVCYAPLNHILGRSMPVYCLTAGGLCSFTLKPDMSTLFEDVRLTNPSRLSFFPRVFELIYQHYQNEVAKRVREGEDEASAAADVKADMGENFLGNRLLSGMVGGAPTSPAVREFMAECFEFHLIDGYGNTESGSGSISLNGKIQENSVSEYKLRNVPELGYYTSDKPYPRGELCYKSEVGIAGYYKDPKATAGLFDEDGFSLTGDIVEEIGPGEIRVVDRVKDVLKLSQGEYVALGALQTKYESGSAAIKQIFLYGNSLQAYLLAVVVPDLDAVASLIGVNATDADLKALLRREMARVAKEKDIKSFELPRDFLIELEPFSQENGLLSSVRKRLMPALKKKYGQRLEAMYEADGSQRDEAMKRLKDPGSNMTTAEKVSETLKVTLNIESITADSDGNFTDLGGDSLAAVSFSLTLEEVFGVNLPADLILSPTADIARWSAMIDKALSGDGGVSFESIHGKDAKEIFASDLKLNRFLSEEDLVSASTSKPMVDEEKVFLLTGANGFLGRFVCMELLQKAAAVGGKVVCLIRAQDDASARRRLDAVFSTDAALNKDYSDLASKHLEVLAGDVGEPDMGLDKNTHRRLTQELDRIVHVAALVNHMMTYQNFFYANVVATAEIIRLALLSKRKPIDFVSSVAANAYLDVSNGFNEDAPLRECVKLTDSYAAGYGISKWAGEVLLQDAHANFGIPVNVFRGDMMLAHDRYGAQINTDDMFTRLLFSVIETGLAPRSFYQLDDKGQLQQGHYNGLPVNIVAQTVTAGRKLNTDGYKNVYISNYHYDDGCSLDAFVDWIEAEGYSITRIDDHQEWVQRFEQKLKSLPEERKQHSVIALMSAFHMPYPAHHFGSDCDNFQTLMPDIPHLDQRFIQKCIRDMKAQNLLA
ncbi:Carboxylic acid reductase [Zhongshania aliphaticivorans]|uniref:Carboxylic acid reductase n=1 Tax=Zhongshania aliphaticivorans TaxID=1470434 RepID=A0A5S9Q1G8_9GAMM|nr:thioester reductase domain-containing protein [Zhongshania aliphaticivorans]CAA0093128.1 Carboxylic acid reductase [Zhongshania aliphaticivorans]CAA0110907.1 Carboxylic acid reductase [Zhongshania aliphaticivorans]